MIQVKIKNVASQQYTHGSSFETMELAEGWIQKLSNHSSFPWGKPEHTIQVEVSPYIPAQYEEQSVLVKEAVLDEEGNELEAAEYELQMVEISPAVEAVFEDQVVPAEFEIEISDISAQIAQELINVEAKQFLNDTDKLVLRHRDQKELGIPTRLSEEEFQALLVERQAARDRVV
jgi:hypothetical protein